MLDQESGGWGQVQAVVLSSWLSPHLDGEGGSGVSAALPLMFHFVRLCRASPLIPLCTRTVNVAEHLLRARHCADNLL